MVGAAGWAVAVGAIRGLLPFVGWRHYNLAERIRQVNVSAKIRHEQEGCRGGRHEAADRRGDDVAPRRAGNLRHELGSDRGAGRRGRRHRLPALPLVRRAAPRMRRADARAARSARPHWRACALRGRGGHGRAAPAARGRGVRDLRARRRRRRPDPARARRAPQRRRGRRGHRALHRRARARGAAGHSGRAPRSAGRRARCSTSATWRALERSGHAPGAARDTVTGLLRASLEPG